MSSSLRLAVLWVSRREVMGMVDEILQETCWLGRMRKVRRACGEGMEA